VFDVIPESIKLINYLNTGEYGANFVAIHTVAQWCRCSTDSVGDSDAVSADIKLEQENRSGRTDEDAVSLPNHIYHPRSALKKSLQLWLEEFKKNKSMWGPITQPHATGAPPVSIAYTSTTSSAVQLETCSSTSCLDVTTTTTTTTSVALTTGSSSEVIDSIIISVNFYYWVLNDFAGSQSGCRH
jgi:protein O-GlcNAcase / histone acetyltransferase